MNLSKKLRNHIKGDFLIAGIGNELKEFDKIGIQIVKKGKEIYPDKFIDCGVAPENYLDKIINRGVKTLIILDAVHYEGNDAVRLLFPEDLSIQGISTHSLSLDFIAEYLRNYGIQSIIIGIKPNKNIKKTQEKVLSTLLELIKSFS